ncbi:MAG: glycosyltransferase family A protein [Candidatus Nanohaloarchaea archaeon]|nr:glycosyltransferase family A protein [Candidatus Nanohaloarchaea archaeon]
MTEEPFASGERGVTVVIPTRNREEMVKETLNKVIEEAGRAGIGDKFEVFVVVDGSGYELPEFAISNLEVIHIPHKHFRPSMLRNVAAGASHYDQLIFLDDDCIPEKGWLEAYWNAFEPSKPMFGPIQFIDPETGEKGDRHPVHAATDTPRLMWTANISIPRKLFFKLGGLHPLFDQRHQVGEGAEFGWRADSAGYDIKHVEDAEVEHQGLRADENSVRQETGGENKTEVYNRLRHRWVEHKRQNEHA